MQEHTIARLFSIAFQVQMVPGAISPRRLLAEMVNVIEPDTFHRVDLLSNDAWSLCITGPKVARADGEASWSFWDRDTGALTPWREFVTRLGLVPTPTPPGLREPTE